MIDCTNCEEEVPGEMRGLWTDPSGEVYNAGHWYNDSYKYTCSACGHVNTAHCDGENAEFIDPEEE